MVKKCQITVMKMGQYEDLIEKYENIMYYIKLNVHYAYRLRKY